jgi:chromate transporter
MIYLKLYWVFVQIGLFSIGGGYAALPLIEQHVVNDQAWFTMAEFADMLAICQISPGAIALNASTFVGTSIGGIPGALVATAGCVTPSAIIVLILAYFYRKYRSMNIIKGVLEGLSPAVVSLIANAAISIVAIALWGSEPTYAITDISPIALVFFGIGIFLLRKFKVPPIRLMLASGVLAMGVALVTGITI